MWLIKLHGVVFALWILIYFLHIFQHNRTIDAVYDVDNSVETLLDLLQIYREKAGDKVAEKGGNIFTKACFLLVLFVQDERRAMVGVF